MTREEVVRISNSFIRNKLTTSEYVALLLKYCIERGKPHKETNIFIEYIVRDPDMLLSYFMKALQWYQSQYSVYKLYSKPGSLPPQINNGRSLILIY